MNYLQPKQKLKQIFVNWMSLTCRHLRLTSFIFGGRHPEEEGSLVYHSWSAWFQQLKPSRYPAEGTIDNVMGREVSFIWTGRLLCVPRHDSVPIIEERRMLVPLDNYTLEPLDDAEQQLGHPAASAPGGEEANTIVVYSPPGFKPRIMFFVGFMWFSIIVFACAVTIVPVLLGRWMVQEVHDIYAFAAGWLILLGLGVVANQVVLSATDILDQSSVYDTIKSFTVHAKQWG
jgi:E3 ubiquitin-protein ligase DOA10